MKHYYHHRLPMHEDRKAREVQKTPQTQVDTFRLRRCSLHFSSTHSLTVAQMMHRRGWEQKKSAGRSCTAARDV